MHAGICESVPVSKCSYGFNLVQCLSLQIKKLKHREAYTDLMVAGPWPYTERRQGGWLLLFGQMFSFQEINEGHPNVYLLPPHPTLRAKYSAPACLFKTTSLAGHGIIYLQSHHLGDRGRKIKSSKPVLPRNDLETNLVFRGLCFLKKKMSILLKCNFFYKLF